MAPAPVYEVACKAPGETAVLLPARYHSMQPIDQSMTPCYYSGMDAEKLGVPETCCLHCHFLIKWSRSQDGTHPFCLTPEERATLTYGDTSAFAGNTDWSIACAADVWDWANKPCGTDWNLSQVLWQQRRETCFFYEHRPGLFIPSARELERRESERRERRRDRKLAVWVGIIAALVGAVVGALTPTTVNAITSWIAK